MTMVTQTVRPVDVWFAFEAGDTPDVTRLIFQEHHIGNPIIRSIHGGVVGALLEEASLRYLKHELRAKGIAGELEITTSSIDYLRVTKDAPLLARAKIVRVARRVAFIDALAWQDSEDLPVARGAYTIRILTGESS